MSASDRRLQCAALLACAMFGSACGGDDAEEALDAINECGEGRWVSHGGNVANQRHGCAETAITPESVENLEEIWRITPGSVVGTPVVFDGVVYFGSADRQVHAVELDSGDELWATPLEGAVQSSLAVTEDSVYAIDLGTAGRALTGAGEAAQVYRLDREEGEILAQADYDHYGHKLSVGWSSPVFIEDANLLVYGVASFEVFFAAGGQRTFRGNVRALDGDTLEERWFFDVTPEADGNGPGVSVWSSPAVDTQLHRVFIGTGQGYEDPVSDMSDSLLAIDYQTGERAWVQQYTTDDKYVLMGADNGPDYDVGAPPVLFNLADGTPAVGVGDKEGTFHVHNRRTGDLIWETKLTPGSALGGVMQSAAYEDGEIYVNSNKTGGGTPTLFALNAEDEDGDGEGEVLWEQDLGDLQVFGATTVINGVILFGDMNGEIHVRRATDGVVIWDDPHEVAGTGAQRNIEAIAAGISVVNGTVLVPFGAEAFPIGYFTDTTDMLGGGLAAYRVAD